MIVHQLDILFSFIDWCQSPQKQLDIKKLLFFIFAQNESFEWTHIGLQKNEHKFKEEEMQIKCEWTVCLGACVCLCVLTAQIGVYHNCLATKVNGKSNLQL